MKASYTGTISKKLRSAAAFVNELSGDENFWREVREKPDFSYSDLSSEEIERRIRRSAGTVTIRLWKPKEGTYPRTIAVTRKGSPWMLFYNSRKLGTQSVSSMASTIVHEFIHNVDYFDDGNPAVEMGHGDNSSVGKGNSAPYWIGRLAAKYHGVALQLPALPKEDEPYEDEGVDLDEADLLDDPQSPLGSFHDEQPTQTDE